MKKQRIIITLFFIVITMTTSLKLAGTMGYYALFTEDFVERFCENTDKPQLNCDGKCVLAKMLLKKSNNDPMPINMEWLQTETVLFIENLNTQEFSEQLTEITPKINYTNLYKFIFSDRLILPPEA